MTNKYAVMTESFEYNPAKHSIEEAFDSSYDHWDTLIARFDTLEEAREELAKHTPDTVRFSWKLARATVYFIEEEEGEVNEDGEWEHFCSCSRYDFTCTDLVDEEEEEEEE